MDIYGWVFKLYVRFCVWQLSGKNILFFTFNRSVSNAQFFLSNICLQCYQQKNKEKTWRKLTRLHIKTRPPITWLSDTVFLTQIISRRQKNADAKVVLSISRRQKWNSHRQISKNCIFPKGVVNRLPPFKNLPGHTNIFLMG